MDNEALQQCISSYITRPFSHQPSISKYFTWKSWNNVVHFYSLNSQYSSFSVSVSYLWFSFLWNLMWMIFACYTDFSAFWFDDFSHRFDFTNFGLLYGFFNFLIWRFFSPLWFHEFFCFFKTELNCRLELSFYFFQLPAKDLKTGWRKKGQVW